MSVGKLEGGEGEEEGQEGGELEKREGGLEVEADWYIHGHWHTKAWYVVARGTT